MKLSRIISQAPSDLISGAAAHITAGVFEVDLPAAILVLATSEGTEVDTITLMHLAELVGGRSEVFGSGVGVDHCLVSFYVLKVADCGGNARIIFDFLLFLPAGHRESRQARGQLKD